jgi:dolichol kinase
MTPLFWLNITAGLLISFVLCYVNGLLVERYHVKVNYTRKVYHFFVVIYSLYGYLLIRYDPSPTTDSIWGLVTTLSWAMYLPAVRNRVPFIQTMFRSLDRPEDRPYTLRWIFLQFVLGFAVIIPTSFALAGMGMRHLIGIPTLINGFGDGLAEPVGIRFGKHKYQVRALFTDKRYTRSIEGSLCVLISGIFAVLVYQSSFTTAQLLLALTIIPIAMTLAEAFSPHTVDTPSLFLVGGVAVYAILQLPM